jgi:hypothetical protein
MRHNTMTPCFHAVSTFDLPPLQGASLGGRFPGLKPWARCANFCVIAAWIKSHNWTTSLAGLCHH